MSEATGYVMQSGRYANQSIRRVPTDYLSWMVGSDHTEAPAAESELEGRKAEVGAVELLPLAIDRASTGCMRVYERTRHSREGIHTWLVRMATGALTSGVQKEDKIAYGGMLFAFDRSGTWPVLKTVAVEKLVGMN